MIRLLSFFLLCAVLSYAQHTDCNAIPMSLWCSNKQIIEECGFKDACDKHRTGTYNKKINVTVLIEALCPDCQNFMTKTLYPVIYKNFGEFVNIQLVPFGNAKLQPDGSIKCQHGEEECSINKFQSCFIDSMQDESPLPVLSCIEEGLQKKVPFADATQQCFDSLQVGGDIQRLTQSCLVSKLGAQLQAEAARITDNVWPEKHNFVPWVVVNGVSLSSMQGYQNTLPTLLCEWHNGEKAIPFCEASLKMRYRAANLRSFN